MVKPRIYRHDPVSSTGQAMRCPHCGSNWIPKDGRSRGKQTYRCGDRKYRFTPDGNRHYYSEEVKRQALSMYSEISSISAIARVLNVKLGTVCSWVKKSPSGPDSDGHQACRQRVGSLNCPPR